LSSASPGDERRLRHPEACAVLFEMVREINRLRESDLDAAAGLAARLKELASVLGVAAGSR
jgi:hypothetical protein